MEDLPEKYDRYTPILFLILYLRIYIELKIALLHINQFIYGSPLQTYKEDVYSGLFGVILELIAAYQMKTEERRIYFSKFVEIRSILLAIPIWAIYKMWAKANLALMNFWTVRIQSVFY